MGRICEAFGCVPSVALEELERNPVLVIRILEYRGYARTFDQIVNARDEESIPTGSLADLYWQFTKAVMAERAEARRKAEDET